MTKTLVISLCILTFIGFYEEEKTREVRLAVLAHAKHLDKKYENKRVKYDCSGFVRACYKENNIRLPRSSQAQSKMGKTVTNPDIGDLAFFKGSNLRSNKIGHVAIISDMKEDTIFFIHVTQRSGITVNHTLEPYYKRRLVSYKSILE